MARVNVLRVSLSRREVTAFDANGNFLLLLPCSIAADKNKLPPPGEILVATMVPRPNYTYTPDFTPKGAKRRKFILPPGPNNPVGAVWLGLSLPGYGIHGTPKPEQIGRAESHGCFRLANWNARRLYDICDAGVSVVVEK
jgi:lipoprotein-anchoring transpeptidase ErfK/SrfK